MKPDLVIAMSAYVLVQPLTVLGINRPNAYSIERLIGVVSMVINETVFSDMFSIKEQ